MPKNIVFCADGTWNGPEDQTGTSTTDSADTAGELPGDQLTNVVKLYNKLSSSGASGVQGNIKEQEKSLSEGGVVTQVAKYLHGVGDSSNVATKVLGGVFGVGVIARIVRGYTFISRQYRSGDAVYITGFSRGAYTARALAGMIARVGLLNPARYDVNDNAEAYKRGEAAWHLSKGTTLAGHSTLAAIANRVVDFFEGSAGKTKLESDDLFPNVPIKAVGVWDTVGSMGVPLYLKDQRLDLFRFTDSKLSDKVERGFHAMAIDEQRADFPVTQWDRRDGVEQVWFVGAHADVGGGYKLNESLLSDIALNWMMKKFSGVGIKFDGGAALPSASQANAQAIHKPWDNPPFKLLAKSPRQPHIEDVFHASVVERWKNDADYRPSALSFVTADNVDRLTTQS